MCLCGYPKKLTSYLSPVANLGSSNAAGYLCIPSLRKVTHIILDPFAACSFNAFSLNSYVAITKRYPGRQIEIDVSEDGENGSHAVYERNTN